MVCMKITMSDCSSDRAGGDDIHVSGSNVDLTMTRMHVTNSRGANFAFHEKPGFMRQYGLSGKY
jgi:hypothetical protein